MNGLVESFDGGIDCFYLGHACFLIFFKGCKCEAGKQNANQSTSLKWQENLMRQAPSFLELKCDAFLGSLFIASEAGLQAH